MKDKEQKSKIDKKNENIEKTESVKKDRYRLIDEVEESISRHIDNLSFRLLLSVLLVIFTVLILVLPKIYLKNEIYYNSREISKLYNEYSILREENKVLRQKLEYIRFKNQVLDTIF